MKHLLDDLSEVEREFAERWRATDEVVYSTTLDTVPEPRTRLERTFDSEVIQTMKRQANRDLSIGGAGLAVEAIRAGLVDRHVPRLVPPIAGGEPEPSPTQRGPVSLSIRPIISTTAPS